MGFRPRLRMTSAQYEVAQVEKMLMTPLHREELQVLFGFFLSVEAEVRKRVCCGVETRRVKEIVPILFVYVPQSYAHQHS